MLDHALKILALGWPVLPCRLVADKDGKVQKKPLVPWKDWQTRLPNEARVRAWWTQFPDAQLGIATGSLPGIFAVDFDLGSEPLDLPVTVTVQTPSGGRHCYFRRPKDVQIKTQAGWRPHIDIRGDGGFLVLPPSAYPDGRSYVWLSDPWTTPIADASAWLIKEVAETAVKRPRTDFDDILRGVSTGSRNYNATQIIGILLRYLPPSRWDDVAWQLVRAWNRLNDPPLDEYELSNSFESIAKRQREKYDVQPLSEGSGDKEDPSVLHDGSAETQSRNG